MPQLSPMFWGVSFWFCVYMLVMVVGIIEWEGEVYNKGVACGGMSLLWW